MQHSEVAVCLCLPGGEPCHLRGRSEQGSPYGCCGQELAPFLGMELPHPLAPAAGRRGAVPQRPSCPRPLLMPNGRPGLSPALALVAEVEPRSFGAVQQKGRAAAALPGVEIPDSLLLGREALSPQEHTPPCPAHHGDGRAPAVLRTARSRQVGVQPLSAVWRRPGALLAFSVGKLRHRAVTVAKPAASNPS